MSLTWLIAVALLGAPTVVHEGAQPLDPQKDAPYGLDEVPRWLDSAKGPMRCPKVELVSWRGKALKYGGSVRVYKGFAEKLALFEEVARDVSIEVYGRAPTRVLHMGTLNCRRIRTWPQLISEHGMGNGIDIAGFALPALKRGQKAPADLPQSLRRAFQVTVKDHWQAEVPPVGPAQAQLHGRFLRRLTDELLKRPEIFRVLLGPAYPGHRDHFHFDCAPWRLVTL